MDNFRKPYPMKIVDSDDERVSIREDLTIELAGKTISVTRAKRLSEWLFAAADWIDTEKRILKEGNRDKRRGRAKKGQDSE